MLWVPIASCDGDVVYCAWSLPSKVPVPNWVLPSKNLTVPVGVPPSWLVTVAVNVTGVP